VGLYRTMDFMYEDFVDYGNFGFTIHGKRT